MSGASRSRRIQRLLEASRTAARKSQLCAEAGYEGNAKGEWRASLRYLKEARRLSRHD